MKVCMFALHDCDEHHITVRKVARSLAEAGHDVRIIAVLSKGTDPYEEGDGARIFRVPLDPIHRKALRLVALPARMARKLVNLLVKEPSRGSFTARVEGGESDLAKDALKDNPASLWYRLARRLILLLPHSCLSYLDYYFRSFRLARQESADVYHAHDLITLPVAWLCSRVSNGKVVYDSHELWLDRSRWPRAERSRINRFLVQRIESFLIRRTDANIIAGESSGKELSQRYRILPPTVILNVPYYRPFERSTLFRDKLGIPAEEKIILYMGRISYFRGVEEAIQSVKYLSHCSLVIFGFGPDDYIAGLKELIKDEGLADRVHFFDAVPFDEVTRYAMSADVGLVLHKNVGLNYYYVSPNKLFECMAAGLPVVGSNFPDLKRYIEGYKLGVTCNPDNPKDIADAIGCILSDEDRYGEMRSNALEAAKIFNWENESKKLLDVYEGLGGGVNG